MVSYSTLIIMRVCMLYLLRMCVRCTESTPLLSLEKKSLQPLDLKYCKYYNYYYVNAYIIVTIMSGGNDSSLVVWIQLSYPWHSSGSSFRAF